MTKAENKTRRRTPSATAAQLRKRIEESGLTVNAVAVGSGVAQPRLFDFMGGGELSLANAEKVWAFLGLSLRPKGKGR